MLNKSKCSIADEELVREREGSLDCSYRRMEWSCRFLEESLAGHQLSFFAFLNPYLGNNS